MGEKVQKVKKHLAENKAAYITGAACLVVGSAGTMLVLEREDSVKVNAKIIALLNWKSTITIDQHVEIRGERQHIIRDVKTGKEWLGQKKAAEALGVSRTAISRHVNGFIPTLKGRVLEDLGEDLRSRD